ncbi:RelA/SpoT domain-containing protein [Pinirhizobacter soli]|uniref:RelA/SpoT domain-containing protein n=1 Tax=Pinirhizobacter soli TaxID=2786953 RepID=UPI00202A98E3|nr:RelA/SpoT domain-containing protein [Pinirhizobacter soli]
MSGRPIALNRADLKLIDSLVNHYVENKNLVEAMLEQFRVAIQNSAELLGLVHSVRWRVKDPDHLRDKLRRKMLEAKTKNKRFLITQENLFSKINDLAGFRILHLHRQQIVEINQRLIDLFREFRYEVVEMPKARTWDDEYREYYEKIGIKSIKSPKMYTSVHYVISPNLETKLTCEIQVRTLAEELWGEVDHSINYPHESPHEVCREQIKVLARVTSSASRLVDSIFLSSGIPEGDATKISSRSSRKAK